MRRFIPLLVVLLAAALFAQSEPPTQATTQQPSENNYGIPPAPKPGHPLDPNDVAILTGKAGPSTSTRQPYATPQVYYTYPVGTSMFSGGDVGGAFMGQPSLGSEVWMNRGGYGYGYGGFATGSQFADVSTATRPVTPFVIRRPGVPPIIFFGRGTPGSFGVNRWRPNLWFGPGAHFNGPIGVVSSPNRRP